MSKLNTPGATLADRELVKCATDVTGFGLLGHLKSLCESSSVTAELEASAIPLIDDEITRLIEAEGFGARAEVLLHGHVRPALPLRVLAQLLQPGVEGLPSGLEPRRRPARRRLRASAR